MKALTCNPHLLSVELTESQEIERNQISALKTRIERNIAPCVFKHGKPLIEVEVW